MIEFVGLQDDEGQLDEEPVKVSRETFTRRPYRRRRRRSEIARATERACSYCGEMHPAKDYYCANCRAIYMRDYRRRRAETNSPTDRSDAR